MFLFYERDYTVYTLYTIHCTYVYTYCVRRERDRMGEVRELKEEAKEGGRDGREGNKETYVRTRRHDILEITFGYVHVLRTRYRRQYIVGSACYTL